VTVFLQSLTSGLVNGGVYVLLGLGLVLYFRSGRIINLAHGATYISAGLITAMGYEAGWPIGLASAIGVGAAVILMLVVDRVFIRSRTDWPMSTLIILTLGISFIVQGIGLRYVGSSIQTFPSLIPGESIRIGPAVVGRDGLAVVVVALFIGVGIAAFFRHTVVGQAMTAAAEDREAAQIAGVNVDRLRTLSFGFAALLGGVTAVLIIPQASVTYDSGLPLVLRGFIVAGLAAMYWPGRVIVAGFALGLIEALLGAYINPLLQAPLIFGVLFPLVLVVLSRTVKFAGAARA
jgi:branched-chain amino acid transport system permease protein